MNKINMRLLAAWVILMAMVNMILAQSSKEVADQRFLDNADQYNEKDGVNFTDSENTPIQNYRISKHQQVTTKKKNKIKVSPKKKKAGFSFSDMAKRSVRKKNNPTKKLGFSFTDMANISQKNPTINLQSSD